LPPCEFGFDLFIRVEASQDIKQFPFNIDVKSKGLVVEYIFITA